MKFLKSLILVLLQVVVLATATEVWVAPTDRVRIPDNAIQAGFEGEWRVFVGR